MNIHIDWQAHYKAVFARTRPQPVPEPKIPARIRLARTRYEGPIGPPYTSFDDWRRAKASSIRRSAITLSMDRWSVLVAEICAEHGFNKQQLFSARRYVTLSAARHELWWLADRYTRWSLPQMGRASGGRDHTTVLHGIRSYERKLAAGLVASQVLERVRDLPLFQDEENDGGEA
jgi:hypothetical protein